MNHFETIRENREFQRAYTRGKYFVSPLLVCYVVKNRKDKLRVGITTSKKTGNAVKRNRSRRVIREAFRPLAERLPAGYDLVFVARAKTPFSKSQELRRIMEQQFRTAGILAGGKPEGRPHEESH